MKIKEIQELKRKTSEELAGLVKDGSDKLRALKFDLAAGKVKNVSELHELRKKIARMKTFMRQEEINKKQ